MSKFTKIEKVTSNTKLDYKEYIPKGSPVFATLAKEDCEIKTSWGETMKAKKGKDMILTNTEDHNDRWPIEKEIFDKTYTRLKNISLSGLPLYEKTGVVKAAKVDFDGVCATLEGDVKFSDGYYICKGAKDEVWPMTPENFKKKYIKKED